MEGLPYENDEERDALEQELIRALDSGFISWPEAELTVDGLMKAIKARQKISD